MPQDFKKIGCDLVATAANTVIDCLSENGLEEKATQSLLGLPILVASLVVVPYKPPKSDSILSLRTVHFLHAFALDSFHLLMQSVSIYDDLLRTTNKRPKEKGKGY